MITLEFLSQIWVELDQKGELLAAHQFDHINLEDGSPLIVKDIFKQHHLLIPIGDEVNVQEEKRLSGVHVLANRWGDMGFQKRFVDIVCLKPHLNNLFDMVILEILRKLDKGASRPDKICLQVLNRWKELLSQESSELPDKSIMVGVFGELYMLRSLARYDPKIENLWVGPNKARFDFIGEKASLEIKTTLIKKGLSVTIHGHQQLESIPDSELYLAVLRLEELPVGGERILDLVSSLEEVGCDKVSILNKLLALGISAIALEKSTMRFRVDEEILYLVDSQFPSITAKSFIDNKLPNGISDIVYTIDLTAQPPFPLSEEQKKGFYKLFTEDINAS